MQNATFNIHIKYVVLGLVRHISSARCRINIDLPDVINDVMERGQFLLVCSNYCYESLLQI